jgi:hypothetical protein
MGPTATSSPASVSIAVIGDVHGSWGEQDVDYFNRSDYDLILFVGDLGGGALRSDLGVARSISRLTRPTFVLPGNHDAVHIAQLAAEVTQQRSLIALFSAGQERRREAFDKALGGVEMCGYGLHPQRKGTTDFDIISCRPHSMGGPSLAFAPFLSRAYGIDSLTASAERLTSLIDASSSNRLLFFAHNGPTGLGAGRRTSGDATSSATAVIGAMKISPSRSIMRADRGRKFWASSPDTCTCERGPARSGPGGWRRMVSSTSTPRACLASLRSPSVRDFAITSR